MFGSGEEKDLGRWPSLALVPTEAEFVFGPEEKVNVGDYAPGKGHILLKVYCFYWLKYCTWDINCSPVNKFKSPENLASSLKYFSII